MTNPANGLRSGAAPKLRNRHDVHVVTVDDNSWCAMYVDWTLVREGEAFSGEWILGFAGVNVGSVSFYEVSDFERWSHRAPVNFLELVASGVLAQV